MYVQTRSSQAGSGLGTMPKVRSGGRVAQRPRSAVLDSTYPKLYMRPNIDNGGIVPATGPLCTCPDIWLAGSSPLQNFQTALATTNSYATSSPAQVTQGKPNYIYVRAMNGSTQNLSAAVQLYAPPCAVIQWPSKWAPYAVPTDIEHDPSQPAVYAAQMNNVAPGTIGVAQNTFVWANPAPPPEGSDHYCMISWLNTPDNPFPDVMSQLDISALVTNDLGFGWRNVSMVPGAQADLSMQTQLDIPSNLPPGSMQYFIVITPKGFSSSWTIEMSCSQTDAKGNQIQVALQNIPPAGQFLGANCQLAPGFSASLTFSLFSNGAPAPAAGAGIDVQVQYVPAKSELEEALSRNIIDMQMSRALQSAFRGELGGKPPIIVCRLGNDSMRTF